MLASTFITNFVNLRGLIWSVRDFTRKLAIAQKNPLGASQCLGTGLSKRSSPNFASHIKQINLYPS